MPLPAHPVPDQAPHMAARKADPKSEVTLSFEEKMKRLGSIVEELERGELSLEESLQRFEEGIRLSRSSQAELDQAEARILELLKVNEDGSVVTEELPE